MKKILTVTLLGLALTGCAYGITDTQIKNNTAFTLGLEENGFDVSNRSNGFNKADYQVKTKQGKEYRCYVTTAYFMVSDALCSEKGKAGYVNNSGNALLDAANKR